MTDATKDKPTTESEDTKSSSPQLNSPKIDDTGKPTQRAVSSFSQAHAIAKAVEQEANQGRISVAADVAKQYNADPPYDPSDITNAGQGWRNNFSTNFLGSIIDRVKPQFLDPIKSVDTLTHSRLPDSFDDADKKSQAFGDKITNCIRGWSGWNDLLDTIAQEDVLNGCVTPGWIDDDWRPRVYRFDESYLPKGTAQHASKAQFWVISQSILLHDFIANLQDKESVTAAGYDIEGCVKAANETIGSGDTNNPMVREDAIREHSTLDKTYGETGAIKTVELFHVLVREYGGGVDIWTVTKGKGHPIRHQEKLHDSMEDALTLITLQTGNTKFYGSKGLGRMLANIHIAIERARCLAMDNQYLSGLVILACDEAEINTLRPIVRHPFIVVDNKATVTKEQIQFNASEYLILENRLVELAESIAGAFIPPNISQSGSPNTKIEAAQKAEREIAVRQGVLGRFITQIEDLVGAMQRKICSPDNLSEAWRVYKSKEEKKAKGFKVVQARVWHLIQGLKDFVTDAKIDQQPETKIADSEAVNCLIEMMEAGLQPDDIAALALSSPHDQKESRGADRDRETVSFIELNKSNPFQNQAEAYKMQGELSIGRDRINRLAVMRDDPNEQAINQREQLMELAMMMSGEPMPVSATDNHSIHRQTIAGKFSPVIESLKQGTANPGIIEAAKQVVSHYMAHLQDDQSLQPAELGAERRAINEWMKVITGAEAMMERQAQVTGAAPGAAPALNQVQPSQPEGGPQRNPAMDQEADLLHRAAELSLRAGDQQIQKARLELDARKQAHQEQHDAAGAELDTAKAVADQVSKARDAGIRDADAERKAQLEAQGETDPA